MKDPFLQEEHLCQIIIIKNLQRNAPKIKSIIHRFFIYFESQKKQNVSSLRRNSLLSFEQPVASRNHRTIPYHFVPEDRPTTHVHYFMPVVSSRWTDRRFVVLQMAAMQDFNSTRKRATRERVFVVRFLADAIGQRASPRANLLAALINYADIRRR